MGVDWLKFVMKIHHFGYRRKFPLFHIVIYEDFVYALAFVWPYINAITVESNAEDFKRRLCDFFPYSFFIVIFGCVCVCVERFQAKFTY